MSNLQLFTEPGGDGGSEGGDGAGAGGNPGNNNNTTMSFDEFLALEGNQSEFDRRVQKAIDTAVTNASHFWMEIQTLIFMMVLKHWSKITGIMCDLTSALIIQT